MDNREVLDKLAKDTYRELKAVFPSEHDEGKWKHLDDEDQDYYRAVAAAVLHAVVDQLEYVNPGDYMNDQVTVREFANMIEEVAAAR
jgi:hypothetical protein